MLIYDSDVKGVNLASFMYVQANLTELKSFGSPPGAVTNVTAAVMVLLAPNGKIPKDRSWKAAKVTLLPAALRMESSLHLTHVVHVEIL
jgi:hypothetical protein